MAACEWQKRNRVGEAIQRAKAGLNRPGNADEKGFDSFDESAKNVRKALGKSLEEPYETKLLYGRNDTYNNQTVGSIPLGHRWKESKIN